MSASLRARFLVVGLLGLVFFLLLTSAIRKSATVDEQLHITRGAAYLSTGDPRLSVKHPPLINVLSALPVHLLLHPSLPRDDWSEVGALSRLADGYVWRPNPGPERIVFLARLPIMGLGLVLTAVVFRWADARFGPWGGLLAAAFCGLDPNILAHSRLSTTDIGGTCFVLVAAYALWRALRQPKWPRILWAGLALGLALGAKLYALVLGPLLALAVSLDAWTGGPGRLRRTIRNLTFVALVALFGLLTLWGIYGFGIGQLDGQGPAVPAPPYVRGFLGILRYSIVDQDIRGRPVYLLGQISDRGWWYYFPVALATKTPLVTLSALLLATLLALRRPKRDDAYLLAIPLAYFLVSMTSSLNLGYRHILPVIPFVAVHIGRLAAPISRSRYPVSSPLRLATRFLLPIVLVVALGSSTLSIYPHFLAYFNLLGGGPENGWRILVDSNVDWGQDLPALRDIAKRDDLGSIRLSYFGTAHPSYYGLDFEPLPAWNATPEQGNPFTRTYYPHDPGPGVYAISVNHLHGVVMDPDRWDIYASFRNKATFGKAGYSIFLYRVEPTGPPADVALSGLQVDQLAPETFALFGTNDVRLRWFDDETSLVISSQPGWIILDADASALRELGLSHPCTTTDGFPCYVYPPDSVVHADVLRRVERLTEASETWRSPHLVPVLKQSLSPLPLPANLGDQIAFLGYELDTSDLAADSLSLLTAWRVTALPDGPRAVFVHLLAPDGQVVAQWDGLDVLVEGWREGDTILQTAPLNLPDGLPPGQYWLQAGAYNPATMDRLPVIDDGTPIADRILLEGIQVGGTP